jgi:hypothetical protein
MRPTWYTQDWGLFAYSFKKSANLVYSQYRSTRRDAFWFPAVYLYRQWIELGLKSIWFVTSQFDDGLGSVPQIHSLPKLWAPIRSWLDSKELIAVDDDFLPSAERLFAELDKVDPNGTAFRYPPTSIPHADLINFALSDFEAAIEQVDTLFFGLFRLLNEYEEYLSSLRRSERSCG